MPQITVEVDDKGEIVGKPPAEIDALFKRTETTGYGSGLKKGREDALAETQKEYETRIEAERKKWEEAHPQQQARLKELEAEALSLRESENTLHKRYTESARQREENHAKAMADQAEAVTKHQRKLKDMLKSQIRAEAIGAGARDESLSELEIIMSAYVDFDENLETIVKGEDGKPLMKQGKPIASAEFIREYLGKHGHHRKPTGGTGGGARGGGFQGHDTSMTSAASEKAINDGDRSPTAILNLYNATRRKAS